MKKKRFETKSALDNFFLKNLLFRIETPFIKLYLLHDFFQVNPDLFRDVKWKARKLNRNFEEPRVGRFNMRHFDVVFGNLWKRESKCHNIRYKVQE